MPLLFSPTIFSLVNGLLRVEVKIGSMAANTIFLCAVQHGLSFHAIWFQQATLEAFIWAFFCAKVLTVLFCLGRIWRLPFSFSVIDFAMLRSMIGFGAPLILTSLTGWMLLLSDRFFIDAYGTLADIGIYAVAYKFSSMLTIALVQPFMMVWEPMLSPNDLLKIRKKLMRNCGGISNSI